MKKIILSENLAKPLGPFSQAVEVNGVIYTSGQLPVDLATNELELDDIKKATEICLKALEYLAIEGGSTKNDIIKVVVYLNDMKNYQAMNEVYAKFFEGCDMPARTCYAVAALPFNSLIEIEAMIEAK